MGSQQSKCKSLYLPAQSGKTRKVEELIQEYKLGELFDPVDINIIISANNRVLVGQTTARMMKDLATESKDGANDACIKGGVFSWTSGTKKSNITAEALTLRIMNGDIEMVVICAHPTRIRYLVQTLELLANQRLFTKKINIWIDEADNSISLWSKYQKVIEMNCVNQVTLVSATFDSVIAKYKELNVLPYLKTHPDCYVGLRNAIRRETNIVVGSAVEYVRHVITTQRDMLMKPGMRAFIPGSNSTASHDAIADFLHKECGFVVIIINGQRKEILVPGQQDPIDLRCYLTIQNDETPQEFNTQLAKLYKENNWSRFPLAITGYMCIQRGVTFQCGSLDGVHDGFLFDYGIIPPNIKCAAEAYQTMARLFGNIGQIPEYKQVEIFTNSVTFSRVEKQEETARNIARMVAEQGLEVVTKKDLKSAEAPHKRIPYIIQIDEQELREISSTKNKQEKRRFITQTMLSKMDETHELVQVITTKECFQISTPKIDTKRSYKIHILDVVAAASNGSVYGMMDIQDDDKHKSGWQVFIDTQEKRLVVLWEVFN
jgi:hypothetical protein